MISKKINTIRLVALALIAVVAVGAVAGLKITRLIRETGVNWLDIAGMAYDKFGPSDCPVVEDAAPLPGHLKTIVMSDSSDWPGDSVVTKTFALSVSDVNADGKDDILIGAHEYNPYLFINAPTGFTDESRTLFAEGRVLDRHGYTFADLDNDGDLDLAIASGGQDGVGAGAPNLFLRNISQNGVLRFSEEKISADMAEPASRSRSFIPISSPDGKAIDLYRTALLRNGFPNKLFRNVRSDDGFEFETEKNFLTMSTNDHGRGVIADFDEDGNKDYLVVENWIVKIYWHPNSGRGISRLSFNALSATVADLNNDGRLDIFVGAFSKPSKSDHVSYNASELIYVLNKNGANDDSAIKFSAQSAKVQFNLNQSVPENKVRPSLGAEDIFLGSQKVNPKARIFTLERQQASGEPASFINPGIYIWYSMESEEWNMKWIFHDTLGEFKGFLNGQAISEVVTENFTMNVPKPVTDAIFINQGNGEFQELCTSLPAHNEITSDSTVADFNNDGWLDIIGLRQGEQGSPNRELFVLTNDGGTSFTSSRIALREKDKLRTSDLIAHGFFNEDDKPDIVLTNGYGQIPGNQGSPRLMLNSTSSGYQALVFNLEATSANKFGIGASMMLTDANNNIIGFRVHGVNTNISQDTQWLHFGLGDYPAPYHLNVNWPDGVEKNYSFTKPGRYQIKQ